MLIYISSVIIGSEVYMNQFFPPQAYPGDAGDEGHPLHQRSLGE